MSWSHRAIMWWRHRTIRSSTTSIVLRSLWSVQWSLWSNINWSLRTISGSTVGSAISRNWSILGSGSDDCNMVTIHRNGLTTGVKFNASSGICRVLDDSDGSFVWTSSDFDAFSKDLAISGDASSSATSMAASTTSASTSAARRMHGRLNSRWHEGKNSHSAQSAAGIVLLVTSS